MNQTLKNTKEDKASMKIIEKLVVGKKNQETCEDGIVETGSFVCVIDGSTSKTPYRLDSSMANGRLAMRLIARYVSCSLPASATMEDFCQDVTQTFHTRYRELGIEDDMLLHPEKRLTASAIVYSRLRKEIWMVGDCQALVDGKLYENGKPYEATIAQKRVDLILSGHSPTEARREIELSLIAAMRKGQNKQYAVIDGFPICLPGVKVIQAEHAREIVLASDGYPFLYPTLSASEEALSVQLTSDPQNIKTFIATKGLVEGNKSFDDRAYVRFTV